MEAKVLEDFSCPSPTASLHLMLSHINFNYILCLLLFALKAYKTVSISAISVLYVHRYKSCALPPKLRLPNTCGFSGRSAIRFDIDDNLLGQNVLRKVMRNNINSPNLRWLQTVRIHRLLQLTNSQPRHVQLMLNFPQVRVAQRIATSMVLNQLLGLENSTAKRERFSHR